MSAWPQGRLAVLRVKTQRVYLCTQSLAAGQQQGLTGFTYLIPPCSPRPWPQGGMVLCHESTFAKLPVDELRPVLCFAHMVRLGGSSS